MNRVARLGPGFRAIQIRTTKERSAGCSSMTPCTRHWARFPIDASPKHVVQSTRTSTFSAPECRGSPHRTRATTGRPRPPHQRGGPSAPETTDRSTRSRTIHLRPQRSSSERTSQRPMTPLLKSPSVCGEISRHRSTPETSYRESDAIPSFLGTLSPLRCRHVTPTKRSIDGRTTTRQGTR